MAKIKVKGAKKLLKKAHKNENFANKTRGFKIYTILKVVDKCFGKNPLTFSQLNSIAFKFSRPGVKYDNFEHRGYICCNFYRGGYMRTYFDKVQGGYVMNDKGRARLKTLKAKFNA